MKKYHLIESVINPGSFWADSYNSFKGFIYATHYNAANWEEDAKKASKFEPCTLTAVWDDTE